MALPFFYIEDYNPAQSAIQLNEETSKHIVSVLRMKAGQQINLTDGQGNLLTAVIEDDHKKHCRVNILASTCTVPATRQITLAVSLIKNTSRFEWFLEKATEIGIAGIVPLICERTEKQTFRADRMKNVLVSAMLQSQQSWLPRLHEPILLKKIIAEANQVQKFIAHCAPGEKENLRDLANQSTQSAILLIGPEGDFTEEEILFAYQHHFIPVALGETRLRTETAAFVAATLLTYA